ncbi:MAG: Flp family type IVb pilin [Janthinobacterium lividum]
MNIQFKSAGREVVKFLKQEDGATAVEYALISGLMALLVIAAIGGLGTSLTNFFRGLGSCLTGLTSTTTAASCTFTGS